MPEQGVPEQGVPEQGAPEPPRVLVTREGRTLVITIDRPAVRNAVDLETALALAVAFDLLDGDDGLSVGVLTGSGGSFSAGMDLKAFLQTGQRPEVPGRGLAGMTRTPPAKPLIAAVEGFALAGGFEMVLCCDLVVASREASFGLPEVRRGLIAGSGGLIRLPHRIPPAIAMEHALTGEPLSAVDAHRWGLVNRLTEPGQALAEALLLADSVAANGPLAVRVTKQVMSAATVLGNAEAWVLQDEVLLTVVASHDAREGSAAFVEKRQPVWQGR